MMVNKTTSGVFGNFTAFHTGLMQIGTYFVYANYAGGDGNDLTITMNADGTSNVVVNSFNDTTAGDLAIAGSTGSWATTADITAASNNLKTALTTLRSQAQSLSSNLSTVQIRQDFTKAMINTLQSGADNLVLADTNEEGANMLALQTRQQLSTTALSLAAQADQHRPGIAHEHPRRREVVRQESYAGTGERGRQQRRSGGDIGVVQYREARLSAN